MELTKNYVKSNPLLDTYMKEINKYNVLTFYEEAVLAEQIKLGNQKALDKLVSANLKFVVLVAKQFQGNGVDVMDLIAEGNEGLIIAARKFDPSRTFKFVSFAVWYIRQSITTALSTQSRIVRLPLNRLSNVRKVNKCKVELTQILGHNPTIDELADHTELDINTVSDTINMMKKYMSVDEEHRSGSGKTTSVKVLDTLVSTIEPTDLNLNIDSVNILIQQALDMLTSKEKTIVSMFYGIGYPSALTLDEITLRTGLTRERARQIKEKGIRKLRHESRSKNLKNLL